MHADDLQMSASVRVIMLDVAADTLAGMGCAMVHTTLSSPQQHRNQHRGWLTPFGSQNLPAGLGKGCLKKRQ